MICSVKYSSITCSSFTIKKLSLPRNQLYTLPAIHNVQASFDQALSSQKPLHFNTAAESLTIWAKPRKRITECKAYEAERSLPLEINIELPDEQARIEVAQRLKIGLYFATWWALNVVFNICNKKVLNVFPYPWLTSTLSLAAGSLMMLVSWATNIAETPETDMEFWKTLLPVAVADTVGHQENELVVKNTILLIFCGSVF